MTHKQDRGQASFTPPTPSQVRAYLERHRARGPSRLAAWSPLAALTAALALTIWGQQPWMFVVAWVIVVAVLVGMTARIRNVRRMGQRLVQAQELATRRDWLDALRSTWGLLPSLVSLPTLHGQATALIAHCLHELKTYEAAIVAYDHLLDLIPAGQPVSVGLRVHRAVAQLFNDQLTDADDTLQRLRGQMDTSINPAVAASYSMACLMQRVMTNHWAEAADYGSSDLVDQLRPLGIEAGYGYALMALSCHQLAAAEDPGQQQLAQQADLWWSRATLLLPVAALVNRFSELSQITHLQTNQTPDFPKTPPTANE